MNEDQVGFIKDFVDFCHLKIQIGKLLIYSSVAEILFLIYR